MVRKYLDRGHDVNYRPHSYSLTCLMAAASGENEEIVSLLLQQPGIDVIARTGLNGTALHRAVEYGTPAILRLLLDFPGIDKKANLCDITPLRLSIDFEKAAHFAEF